MIRIQIRAAEKTTLKRRSLAYKAQIALLITIILLTSGMPNFAVAAEYEDVINSESTRQNQYDLICADGFCELRMRNAGTQISPLVQGGTDALIRVLQENVSLIPDQLAVEMSRDVSVHLPIGGVDLLNANITVELSDEQSVESLSGSARIPLSLIGFANSDSLVTANIGLDFGDKLKERFGNHVPDAIDFAKQYFYFHFEPGANFNSSSSEELEAASVYIPPGQQFLVIHDPTETLIYADGHLNVELPHITGASSPLAGSVSLSTGTLMPFLLVKHAAGVHVSWLISEKPGESFLQVDGDYVLQEGMVSKLVGVDTGNIGLAGSMRVDADGILLRGVTDAALVSGRLFDSGLGMETFIPFREDFWKTRIAISGHVAMPVFTIRAETEQQVEGTVLEAFINGVLPAEAVLEKPTIYVVAKDRTNDAVVLAGRGLQSVKDSTSTGYQWTIESVNQGIRTTSSTAGKSYDSVLEFAESRYGWISQNTSEATASFIDTTKTQFDSTKNFTVRSYNSTTDVISSTTGGAIDSTKQGMVIVSHAVSSTASSIMNSSQQGVVAAGNTISSTKNSINNAPYTTIISKTTDAIDSILTTSDDVSNQQDDTNVVSASCPRNLLRSNWCRVTGRCEVPPDCKEVVNE